MIEEATFMLMWALSSAGRKLKSEISVHMLVGPLCKLCICRCCFVLRKSCAQVTHMHICCFVLKKSCAQVMHIYFSPMKSCVQVLFLSPPLFLRLNAWMIDPLERNAQIEPIRLESQLFLLNEWMKVFKDAKILNRYDSRKNTRV